MCHWMGSHFYNLIDYNGFAFSYKLLVTKNRVAHFSEILGLRIFHLVSRDLNKGRLSNKKLLLGHSILELLKWWNWKYFIYSPIMDIWNEETLNCFKNSNLKVDFARNGTERLFIFVQWKVCENSWHAVRFKMILVRHIYSQNLTRGTKLIELNTNVNFQIRFFPKWMYFVNESK